jgi:2-polyprenyl-3-methyl-5-hydroxy-6-metoxy-1,4-benzoquinol methylase
MPIETIQYKGKDYPAFQATGNASRFILPLAEIFCKGQGLDIGYSKQEWKLPGAIGIEPGIDFTYDAINLPQGQFDYIFSSHMLEHYKGNFAQLLDYWTSKIKMGGILFLYLPHMKYQHYWRPWENTKHIHYITPKIMKQYFEDRKENWKHCFISGKDLNYSFTIIAEKIYY